MRRSLSVIVGADSVTTICKVLHAGRFGIDRGVIVVGSLALPSVADSSLSICVSASSKLLSVNRITLGIACDYSLTRCDDFGTGISRYLVTLGHSELRNNGSLDCVGQRLIRIWTKVIGTSQLEQIVFRVVPTSCCDIVERGVEARDHGLACLLVKLIKRRMKVVRIRYCHDYRLRYLLGIKAGVWMLTCCRCLGEVASFEVADSKWK